MAYDYLAPRVLTVLLSPSSPLRSFGTDGVWNCYAVDLGSPAGYCSSWNFFFLICGSMDNFLCHHWQVHLGRYQYRDYKFQLADGVAAPVVPHVVILWARLQYVTAVFKIVVFFHKCMWHTATGFSLLFHQLQYPKTYFWYCKSRCCGALGRHGLPIDKGHRYPDVGICYRVECVMLLQLEVFRGPTFHKNDIGTSLRSRRIQNAHYK